MKIYKLVNVLGALNDTGKLASDMYELGKKRYYSKESKQMIPVSEMDFQHMVRAFVKLIKQDEKVEDLEKSLESSHRAYKLGFERNGRHIDEINSLKKKVEKLDEIIEEKDDIIKKLSEENEHYKRAYHDAMQFGGARYVFSEIPNNEHGKRLISSMKVYINDDSYTMRVRGQHIKPELKGTGATHYGQSIEQSTHLRVYIDKK